MCDKYKVSTSRHRPAGSRIKHRKHIMITPNQSAYLLSLINKATGNSYRFLSQVKEDGIGKESNKVKGISSARASALISEWKEKAEAAA